MLAEPQHTYRSQSYCSVVPAFVMIIPLVLVTDVMLMPQAKCMYGFAPRGTLDVKDTAALCNHQCGQL